MSTPRPRPQIDRIRHYVPGSPSPRGQVAESYKLSSNESPFGPLPGVLAAARAALDEVNRYPDLSCSRLRDALGEHLGVPADLISAGSGSVALIYHLLTAFCGPGDEVVHAWRSFEAYPIAITAAGATGIPVPLTEGPDGGRHDLDAMAAAINERTRVVLLCTPNNPTGPALSHAETERFVARAPADILVVIDEAYHEFVRMTDPLDALRLRAEHPNVVVLRTFSKAYGLAGLRVGYAVAHPSIGRALRAVSLPFGVSSAAQAAAIASLAAAEEMRARTDQIVARRARIRDAARAAGWSMPDPQGNFVWLELGEQTTALTARAEHAGLVLRPFPREGVRVTVGEPESISTLIDVLGAVGPRGTDTPRHRPSRRRILDP